MKSLGAIIVAAGFSTRMGGIDKVWAELARIPLFVYSIRAFDTIAEAITLIVRQDDVDRARSVLARERLKTPIRIVAGGPRRQDSVRNGLESVDGVDLIAIHDAARPLVSRELIARVTDCARESAAAVPAVPVADTLKRVADRRIVGTVDRANLWAVQTPQTFSRALALEAHSYALKQGIEATDDASLVEAVGEPVTIVDGSPWNIKVTDPGDLARAEAILHLLRTESDLSEHFARETREEGCP